MQRRTLRAFTLGLVLFPVAVACGASDNHKAVSPNLKQLAESACKLAFHCCTANEASYYLGTYYTKETCADRLLADTELGSSVAVSVGDLDALGIILPNAAALDKAVNEHRTKIDGAALSACTASLDKAECNTPVTPPPDDAKCTPPPEPKVKDNPCDPSKIFVGQLGEGDECTSSDVSFECKPGLRCAPSGEFGDKGECVRASKEGEYCRVAVTSPVPSSASSSDPLGALGGITLTGADCDTGLYCSGLDGKCHKPAGPGEPCAYGDQNVPPSSSTLLLKCRSDLSCDWITSTCVVQCEDGAECGSDKQCDEDKGLKCLGMTTGAGGRCGTPRDSGLPCTTSADCKEELRCATNPADPTRTICQDRLADGSPCAVDTTSPLGSSSAHDQCQSGFCDPATAKCTPQVTAPGLCPSRDDAQCAHGRCVTDYQSCTVDQDCPGAAHKCDLQLGQCVPYCSPLKQDGTTCTVSNECESGYCIGDGSSASGICRTPPLGDNEPCTDDSQCTSKFCGLETNHRVCTTLPLGIGSACDASSQCESLVCYGGSTLGTVGTGGFGGFGTGGFGLTGGFGGFGGGVLSGTATCVAGLDEGALCGESTGKPPCDPKKFYCDGTQDPPRCVAYKETGERCTSNEQCRGGCEERNGWMVCGPAAAPGSAICHGPDAQP